MRVDKAALNDGVPGAPLWVTPDASEGPTGGALFDRQLLEALSSRGVEIRSCGLEAARVALERGAARSFWVDSLYLELIPELARLNAGRRPLNLVLHYLPSLLRSLTPGGQAPLEAYEREALDLVDGFLVTSHYMKEQLCAYGYGERPMIVVEPGVHLPPPSARAFELQPLGTLKVLIVASVVPNKGLLEFFSGLVRYLGPTDRMQFYVLGSLDIDPEYANALRLLVRQIPRLASRVQFSGAVDSVSVMEWMRRSDLLLSASRMESYGMALAEARAVGLPILACRGGNVEAHVDEAAGGLLVDNPQELARTVVWLQRRAGDLAQRRARALGQRRRHSWEDAAQMFLRGAAALG